MHAEYFLSLLTDIPFDQRCQVVKVTAVCRHVGREAAGGLGCSQTGVDTCRNDECERAQRGEMLRVLLRSGASQWGFEVLRYVDMWLPEGQASCEASRGELVSSC